MDGPVTPYKLFVVTGNGRYTDFLWLSTAKAVQNYWGGGGGFLLKEFNKLLGFSIGRVKKINTEIVF